MVSQDHNRKKNLWFDFHEIINIKIPSESEDNIEYLDHPEHSFLSGFTWFCFP